MKGWFAAKNKFGNPSISMEQLLKPTIEMCKKGIKVSRSLFQAISHSKMKPIIRNDTTLRQEL